MLGRPTPPHPIEERQKPDVPVQCFDMATDSESEDEVERGGEDQDLDAGVRAASSESTGSFEELGSCSEGRPTCCTQADFPPVVLGGEISWGQLTKGLNSSSTVGELLAQITEQMSFTPPLLTRSGHALTQLQEGDLLGAVLGNLEDLVLRHALIIEGAQPAQSTTERLERLELENAELRSRLRILDERPAEEAPEPQAEADAEVAKVELSPGAPCTPAAVEATEAEAVELPVEDFAVVQDQAEVAKHEEVVKREEDPVDVEKLGQSESKNLLPSSEVREVVPPPETPLPELAPVKENPSKRKGTPLCVSLLSMQSPDQPAMKLDMHSKSTIAELRAEVMNVFEMDERTAKRLRFLRKRGTCYVSFKEGEHVREKIFLHDPDIRALSGVKLRSFSGVGGSSPTPELGGLKHSLPAGVDSFMQEFILHTFSRMNEEELASWNALPKFVIWTIWFDLLSSPLFRKCLDGKFRDSLFGPNFDRKASIRLAKEDPVLREYAFHKRQLISMWFHEEPEAEPISTTNSLPEAAKKDTSPVEKVRDPKESWTNACGLFDFDELEEAEMK